MKNKCATRVLTLVSLYHNFFCVLELETQFHDPLIAGTFSFYNPHLLLICSTNNRDLYVCKSKEEMKQKRKDKITIQNITAIVSFTRLFNKEFWSLCRGDILTDLRTVVLLITTLLAPDDDGLAVTTVSQSFVKFCFFICDDGGWTTNNLTNKTQLQTLHIDIPNILENSVAYTCLACPDFKLVRSFRKHIPIQSH